MPTLLLLRHAKSAWGDPGIADHDRPLAPRGLRDAPRMGRWLAREGLVPETTVSSTAVRARRTARLALQAAEAPLDSLKLDGRLYGATPWRILARAAEAAREGAGGPILIVGHNPGLEDLVRGVRSLPARLAWRQKLFPTAALAVISVDGAPRDLVRFEADLRTLVRPRDLRG